LKKGIILSHLVVLLLSLVNHVYAADQPFADQFLGSPLLVLVALFIIDGIAITYHKLRK